MASSSRGVPGIHHVTAIAGDPQRNVDFYAGLLGLRLVKRTVNFDDPGSYHLYFGDEVGTPGTILTFFSWPGAPRGRAGTGQPTAVAFSVPRESLDFWLGRLAEHAVDFEGPEERFGEQVVSLHDPDGLRLELISPSKADPRRVRESGPVPPEHAIRGLHGVTLSEEGYELTGSLLTETLGFRLAGEAGSRFRYEATPGDPGGLVDVLCLPDALSGRTAAGTVHHVAWRAPDDEAQRSWREKIAALGFNVTPVIDRLYFRSIYFREPGGVLFEIATDLPGFEVDEPREELGKRLALPPWLEPARERLERRLQPIGPPRSRSAWTA